MSLVNMLLTRSVANIGAKELDIMSQIGWYKTSEGILGTMKLGANTRLGNAQQGFDNRFQTNLESVGFKGVRDVPEWTYIQATSGAPYVWTTTPGPAGLAAMLAQLASGGVVTDWNFVLADFCPPDISKPLTTGPELTALGNFATEVVNHYNAAGYSGKFRLGFGNEFNSVAPTSTPAEYYTQLATVYTAVKAADSTVKVGAPVGIDLDWTGGYAGFAWLDDFLATNWAAKCDYFEHHIYDDGSNTTVQLTPEALTFNLEKIHSRVLRNNPTIPICISETGWYTQTGTFKISQLLQAQYYSRWPFLLRTLPNVDSAQFWELKDNVPAGYGFMLSTWTAKTSLAVITRVVPQVQGASKAVRYNHINGSSIGVCLTTPTGKRYAIWDTAADGTLLPIAIYAGASGTLTITNMGDGTTSTISLSAGTQSATLTIGLYSIVLSADNLNYYLVGMEE